MVIAWLIAKLCAESRGETPQRRPNRVYRENKGNAIIAGRQAVKRELAICLVLASAAFAPVAASAQVLLPPYEIATSVRSMGLKPISQPILQGRRYVLRAIDRRGVEVDVAVNGFNGRVLFVEETGNGPVRATRAYPADPASPGGGYQRQAPADPDEPSVIYATPREIDPPRPPVRVPSVAKPPVPKVAAKPPAKPASPPEAAAPAETSAASAPPEKSPDTAGSTMAAAPPSPPPEKNPALAAPPVQGFD